MRNCVQLFGSSTIHAVWFEKVPFSNLIKWYGFQSLFSDAHFTIIDFNIGPLIQGLLHYIWRGTLREELIKGVVFILRDLGNTFISYLSPLRQVSIDEEVFRVALLPDKSLLEVKDIDNDVLFGIFVVLAIVIEFVNRKTDSQLKSLSLQLRSLYIGGLQKSPSQFYQLLFARFKEPKGRIQTILDKYGFTTEQQEFIQRWIRKEINLID